jgi:NAD(P)-dependent dehydrogenase (short-subunit alcohol dehydrogenase family)
MTRSTDRLAGSVVLLTGATGGLGVHIAQRLASEGARIAVTDLDPQACRDVVDRLPGGAELHTAIGLDVSTESQWSSAVAGAEARLGPLRALVNNAALGSLATVEDETEEHWQRVVAVGQTGVWLGMKHCGPRIRENGGGSIVNMCSILGTVGGMGNSVAYHAAKGAVRTMTKNAALHWATEGVRVNSLHPGFIATGPLLERYEGTERYAAMLAKTPMGRLGRPEEIAAVVAFLVSEDSSFMTGSELYADGGWTAA